MSNETIQAIERNLKVAKKAIDLGASLGRLNGNKDFGHVVTSGYFEQEAIRLVHLKSDPNMQSVESQRAIVSQIDAIGALKQYFTTVRHLAALAGKSVAADQETLEELAAEELNNG